MKRTQNDNHEIVMDEATKRTMVFQAAGMMLQKIMSDHMARKQEIEKIIIEQLKAKERL